MAGTYVCLRYHLVWSTLERRPLLDPSWAGRLYEYMGGVLTNKNGRLLCAGGTPDHVHLHVSLPSTLAVADAVNALKANSSRWINDEVLRNQRFSWQEGYGGFTISMSGVSQLDRYIQGQERHHRARDFKAEFLALLAKYEIEYDERYIWR